jgi:hypothetical protein
MKRHTVRNVLIAKLAALALSALCFLQAPVRAQGTGVIVIFPSVGVTPNQSLSLTFFNPNGTPVRAQVRSHHPGGVVVCLADGSVRAGALESFVLKYSAIPLPVDERTGRKQILASVSLTFSEANKPVVASVETIDVRDGTSNTVFVGEIPPSQSGGSGNDTIKSGFGNDIIMGIPPGHKLLFTIFNPRSSGSDYAPSRVKLYAKNGNLIAQSPELVIPPGGLGSFEFNPYITIDYVEAGTNRALVRIELSSNSESGGLSTLPNNDVLLTDVISFEVIDNSTGKTVTLSGQQCLVFYLSGTPSK